MTHPCVEFLKGNPHNKLEAHFVSGMMTALSARRHVWELYPDRIMRTGQDKLRRATNGASVMMIELRAIAELWMLDTMRPIPSAIKLGN